MRVPTVDPQALTEAQAKVYKLIADGPRGRVGLPYQYLLHSPELTLHIQNLGQFVRYGSSLSAAQSELAILVSARHWKAGYVWNSHCPVAEKAGVDAQSLELLRTGGDPAFGNDAALHAVYAFSHELLKNQAVSDATWAAAHKALGTQGVVDLVGVLGYYTLFTMSAKVFQMPVQAGTQEPF